MVKCLSTVLKAKVNNDLLPIYGEVALSFKSTDPTGVNCHIKAKGWGSVRVIGDGYILDSSGANPVKEKIITPSDFKLYFSTGTYKIGLNPIDNDGPFDIRGGGASAPFDVRLNLDDIQGIDVDYCGLLLIGLEAEGSIEGIRIRTVLDLGIGKNNNIYGSIDELSLTTPLSLNTVRIPFTNISGNIGVFAGCKTMQILDLHRTSCTGDINTLAQGMCDNSRASGTLTYNTSESSTYNGNSLANNTVVTVNFLSTTSYTVTISGNTDTWTKSGGTWSKA